MPSPYIKKLAKETGKSEKEVEKLWRKAKDIAAEEFGKAEKDFGSKEFAYTTGVVKKMLGVDESILNPSIFLESKYSAKDYLEEVVTSASFSIGNVQPPDKDPEEEEDEEEVAEKVKKVKESLNIVDEDPDDNYLKQLDDIINKEL